MPESQCSDKLNINLRAVKKQSHLQWVFLHIFKAIPLHKVFFLLAYFIVINKSWKNLPKNQSKRDYEKKELSSAAKDQSASAAPDIFDKFLVHLLHFINSANKHKASSTLRLDLCHPASPKFSGPWNGNDSSLHCHHPKITSISHFISHLLLNVKWNLPIDFLTLTPNKIG